MRQTRVPQTSFTSGELDPRLLGRIETTRYYSGASLLRNVLVIPQGGVRRRPGMRHLNILGSFDHGIRCIPFAFNTEQTYNIALVAFGFHVWLNDGTYLGSYGGAPWNAIQAAQMNVAQSADTLLLVHPDVRPHRIRRGNSHTAWSIDPMPMSNIPTHDFGAGAEAVISDTRGWPECVTFHQGRLWLAGFRSRPASAIGSVVADFFNFDRGTALDDRAIYITIDSDQVNAIYQISSGRTLQFFTSGAEHAVMVDPPITPANVAVQEQTRRGIRRFTRLCEVDGSTMFVQRGGAALRSFLYDNVEQAFNSDLLSLLAPHLIRDPCDVAARKGATGDDADHVLLVNNDGTVTVLTTLRAQEVAGFSRWETDGAIRSVAALASGEVFFAVCRDGQMRMEMWSEAHKLDGAVTLQSGTPIDAVPDLGHLDGRQVGMLLDGAWLGTGTVTGSGLLLPRRARVAEIGLRWQPEVSPMPVEPRDPSGNLIGRRCRASRITARVRDTGLFEINGRPVILRTTRTPVVEPAQLLMEDGFALLTEDGQHLVVGDIQPVLDLPPPVVSGDITLQGLLGWRTQHIIKISQPVPGPFTLLALSLQISIGE